MKTINLTEYTVELIDNLTWGMKEEIQSVMLDGVKIPGIKELNSAKLELNASVISKTKYKAIELCVKKITDKEGKVIQYSKEWMNNLSIEDGDALYNAINNITNPEKKSLEVMNSADN
jgi:hypothetical protein